MATQILRPTSTNTSAGFPAGFSGIRQNPVSPFGPLYVEPSGFHTLVNESSTDYTNYVFADGTQSDLSAPNLRFGMGQLSIIPQSGYLTFIYNNNNQFNSNAYLYSATLNAYHPDIGITSLVTLYSKTLNVAMNDVPFTPTPSYNTLNVPMSSGDFNYNNASNAYYSGYVLDQVLRFADGDGPPVSDEVLFRLKIPQTFTSIFGEAPQTYETTMYVSGPIPVSGDTRLFLQGPPVPDSGITLYMAGHETAETGCTLHTIGGVSSTNAMDLFLYSIVDKSCDLFLKTHEPNLLDGSMPLVVWPEGSQSGNPTGSMSLFMESLLPTSGYHTLYTLAPDSGTMQPFIPLYMSGPIPVQFNNQFITSVPLMIANVSGEQVGSNQLFIENHIEYSGLTTLHMFGDGWSPTQGVQNLYIENTLPADTLSNSMNLYINGESSVAYTTLHVAGYYDSGNNFAQLSIYGGSGQYFTDNDMNLFISGNVEPRTNTTLYISSADSDESEDNTTLFVMNDTTRFNNLNLYMNNVVGNSSSGQRIFISGDGLYEDFYATRNVTTLFIGQGNTGPEGYMSMYINGPSGQTGSLPMVMTGANIPNAGMTLAMPSSIGPISDTDTLYIHGF